MPEIRHYTVTQTREVKVTANSAAEAVQIADAAFTHGQEARGGFAVDKESVWGNTETRVRVTNINATEK